MVPGDEGRGGRDTVSGVVMAKPRPVLKVYALVQRAVEEGVAHGIRRYHKYHDQEWDDISLSDHVEREVIAALDDVLNLDV